jgi:hypothetical protein
MTVVADEIVGQVQVVNLEINKGYTLSFDLEIWDNATPSQPIQLSAIDARMTLGDTVHDLDALGYATFLDNVVSVVLPSAFTATLPNRPGKWRIGATDAVSGESPLLVRGAVRVLA